MRPGFLIIWMNIPHTNLYGNNAEDEGKREEWAGTEVGGSSEVFPSPKVSEMTG